MDKQKPNHICKVCGTAYYACNACDKVHSWRAICDSSEHYQLYQTVVMFNRHMIDATEASQYIESIGIDTNNISELVPDIADSIKTIMNAVHPRTRRSKSNKNAAE